MNTPVSGTPRLILQLEGATLLLSATVGYGVLDASWWTFALLLLTPDLSILGYLAGPRIGAALYNAVHAYFGPAALGLAGLFGATTNVWPLCLIWLAHIGMDRALGLGLKFGDAFQNTHLGVVGKRVTTQ